MLCADLVGSAGEYSGELAYLPSYIGAATNAYGAMDAVYGSVRKDEVSMTFAGTQTAISFQGRGFPDGVFKSHLHAAACANDVGVVFCLSNPRRCLLHSDSTSAKCRGHRMRALALLAPL